MKPVACWHVSDEERLRNNLDLHRCDLYSLEDKTTSGHPRAKWWFEVKMQLQIENQVQFCCKGKFLAIGTIKSGPYTPSNPIDKRWAGAVDIDDIDWLPTPQDCPCYRANRRFGSHRLGSAGPCS